MTPRRLIDWAREQVFPGYDPVEDGFAYPDPDDCQCTVLFDQGLPVVVETCAFHNARIVAEAERITAEAAH